MERLGFLVCLICVASASVSIDPRGARPVEHGTRADKCATKKEWPFCTSDDWGPKCPSGCRIQGLMDQYDHSLLKRVEKIRSLLDQNRAKHRSTDLVSKQTFDYIKEKLVLDSGSNNNYYDLAQRLRQRITDMKIKIDRQMRTLAAMKDRVRDQVVEMQRLEVDIDMKLRSCKGSCAKYSEHQVDRDSYVTLDKQIQQLDSQSAQSIESVGSLYVMKSRPLKDVVVDTNFKSKDLGDPAAAQQKVDVFLDVKTMNLILEEEGSSSSPATISKVPGTSFSSSSTSSAAQSGCTKSIRRNVILTDQGPVERVEEVIEGGPECQVDANKGGMTSITELGGGGGLFGQGGFDNLGQPSTTHLSTQSVSCTKSIRRKVVQTKDGPVERLEEVIEGGPECQVMADTSKGGMSALFPTLSHTSSSSSSSSSSSTKTLHSGGAKGSIMGDSKTAFMDPFSSDFAAFMTDTVEDDVPDFQARSVMSRRVQRQADYVGKVCLKIKHENKDGRRFSSGSETRWSRQCGGKAAAPLCSDQDWGWKCPSGCRLQGLMSRREDEVDRQLGTVCEAVKTHGEAADRAMRAMTHIYSDSRRAVVSRYVSELKFIDEAEKLSGNLTLLRRRSSRLWRRLAELSASVKKQLDEMYRAEVEIDMTLRSCSGSCRSALPFTVDHLDYKTLRSQWKRLDGGRSDAGAAAAPPPAGVPRIQLLPRRSGGPPPSVEYKRIPTVQRELLTQLEDIGQNRMVLEESAVGGDDEPEADGS